MSKSLKKLMKKVASKEVHEEMAVADAKIGNLIKVYFLAIYWKDRELERKNIHKQEVWLILNGIFHVLLIIEIF